MQSITFSDETATGQILQSWEIEVETDTMTVAELIMLRVEEEIRRRETATAKFYFTLQQNLTEAELMLNPQKQTKSKSDPPDPEAHGYRALEGFKQNAFFVLIGNKQVDRLDEVIQLNRNNPISFVQLTPLVGG